MNKLTKEEVLHVAMLGRLEISDDEIEKYSYQLKALLDEIEKINEVSCMSSDIMISPTTNECILRSDLESRVIAKELVLKNVPHLSNDYISVRGVFDE